MHILIQSGERMMRGNGKLFLIKERTLTNKILLGERLN